MFVCGLHYAKGSISQRGRRTFSYSDPCFTKQGQIFRSALSTNFVSFALVEHNVEQFNWPPPPLPYFFSLSLVPSLRCNHYS